jgi:hypothetical protein
MLAEQITKYNLWGHVPWCAAVLLTGCAQVFIGEICRYLIFSARTALFEENLNNNHALLSLLFV